MSRSKHTDPEILRAVRRLRSPREGRGVGDLSRRRELGQQRKKVGAAPDESRQPNKEPARLRIIVRKPRAEFHHPANKRDVLEMFRSIGPLALYGLRSVEFSRSKAKGTTWSPVFGRYCLSGRIILFEQPLPPWRLSGRPKKDLLRRLERAGAVLTRLADVGAMLVDWPQGTLRRFMLEEVLLHELGHHVLQHHRGKRPARITRTRDHEAFAARFAAKHRAALRKGNSH